MRAGSVRESLIRAEGARLTGGYHLTEDQVAVGRITALRHRSQSLEQLCSREGVFRGPIFRRIYAPDPTLGEPYVSARDLVQADVRPPAYLSRRVGSALLERLRIIPGTILVTCSGMNLGEAIWARPDMGKLCATHDLIRIIPDAKSVLAGYLYAYLAGRFGHASIRKLLYGGSIKHVEPEHLWTLQVPRLDRATELRASEMVLKSAMLRTEATAARGEAVRCVEESLAWCSVPPQTSFQTSSADLQRRLDGFHHSPSVRRACMMLQAGSGSARLATQVESVFEPGRGPRAKVLDAAVGVPFLSSSEVLKLDPKADYLISKRRTRNVDELLVGKADVLVPRSGQRGGVIGRAVLPLPTFYGHAASEHLIRVRCHSFEDACYLWAVLASEPGYMAIVGTAFGTSIPSLDAALVGNLFVPALAERPGIVRAVARATVASAAASELERGAIALVEHAIEAVT